MMRSRLRRAPGIAALLTIAAVLLSGCSATTVGFAASTAGEPAAGSCWNTTATAFFSDPAWRGAPSVSCSEQHNAWTFATLPLSGFPSSRYIDSSGDVTDAVSAQATERCQAAYDRVLGAVPDRATNILWTWILPSDARWKAGARWVRCDVAQTNGGSYESPHFARLPTHMSTLVQAAQAHPADYQYCVVTSTSSSPPESDKSDARQVACSARHDWRLQFSKPLWAASVSWPGQSAVDHASERACRQVTTTSANYTYYDPDKSSWNAGDRAVDCWSQDAD